MMYVDFKAGNKEYKLRLNTRQIVLLEKKLGCNPLMIFGNGDKIPSVTDMVNVLHLSMAQYNHGITLDDAYDIFDAWIADGNATTDFISIITDIYKVSGIMKDRESASEAEAETESGKN